MNSVQSDRRLLFCSYHCFLDPSSGAALATRDLLELLAARGWDCRVFCGPQLDFETDESLPQLLSDQRIPIDVPTCSEAPRPFTLFHYSQAGVPVSIYAPALRSQPAPSTREGAPFLALLERILDQFQPQVLLTYGGHWLAQECMQTAGRRDIPVVFALHNFAYRDPKFFRAAAAVLVPSRFSQDYYRRTLGLDSVAIPSLLNWSRISCPQIERKYLTFVNPQPEKGVFVFARIALELGQRRPDIPIVIIEGRGKTNWLRRTGADLSSLPNLHVRANTPDPRDFYRVSRAVLMPSLWNESFGRVAAEAVINGIPVLASRRGALPEVLEQAGFLFDIPERYTPSSRSVPSEEDAEPWIETIIRLWDDVEFYERERERCLQAREAWRPETTARQYEAFFGGLLKRAN